MTFENFALLGGIEQNENMCVWEWVGWGWGWGWGCGCLRGHFHKWELATKLTVECD